MFYRVGLAGGFCKVGIYLGQCCPCGSVGGCDCCAWGSVPVGFARFIFGQGILAEGFIRGVLGGVLSWGFCPGVVCQGGLSGGVCLGDSFRTGFVPGGFVPEGFVLGVLAGVVLARGFCSIDLAGGGGVSGGVFTRGYFV